MPRIAIAGGKGFNVDKKTAKAAKSAMEECATQANLVRSACARNATPDTRFGALPLGLLDECSRQIGVMAKVCSREGAIRGLAAPTRRRRSELRRLTAKSAGRAIRLPLIRREPLTFPRERELEPRTYPYGEDELPDFPIMDDIFDTFEININLDDLINM